MQNVKTILLVIVLIFRSLVSCSQTNDFESWTDIGLKKKAGEKLSLNLEESIRLNQNSQQIKSLNTDLGVGYNINENLELGANYRLSLRKRPNGYFHKHRGNVDVTLKKEFYPFEVSFRNRVQLEKDSYITKQEDLYARKENRNRLKLSYNIRGVKTDPFFAVEVFHYLTRLNFYRVFETRYQLGVSRDLPGNNSLNIGVIYKRAQKKTIENTMILNIAFKRSF